MQGQYITKAYYITLATYCHILNTRIGKSQYQDWTAQKLKGSPMLGPDDWDRIIYLPMLLQDCHKSEHSLTEDLIAPQITLDSIKLV